MSVRSDRGFRSRDQQSPCHAKMHYPLRIGLLDRSGLGLSFVNSGFVDPGLVNPGFVNPGFVNPGLVNPAFSSFVLGSFRGAQFANDMLPRAMNCQEGSPNQPIRLLCRRRFERFTVRTEPGSDDPIAAHPFVHTTGDCLDLGQFRHWPIVEDGKQVKRLRSARCQVVLHRGNHCCLRPAPSRIRLASKLTMRQVPRSSRT